MSIKEELEQALQNKLDEWQAQANKAEADAQARQAQAKTEQSEAELQEEAARQAQNLHKKIEEGQQRLAELRDASKEQLADLKTKISGLLS